MHTMKSALRTMATLAVMLTISAGVEAQTKEESWNRCLIAR